MTESFAASWYSGAIHKKTGDSLPVRLPFALATIKSLLLAIAIFSGNFISDIMPSNLIVIAYAIMTIAGIKIVIESLRFNPEERIILIDDHKTLLFLSLAGSFNTFFVALALGLIGVGILSPYLLTLVATLIFSLAGLYLGASKGLRPGIRYAGILAGTLILAISLRFFILYFL